MKHIRMNYNNTNNEKEYVTTGFSRLQLKLQQGAHKYLQRNPAAEVNDYDAIISTSLATDLQTITR